MRPRCVQLTRALKPTGSFYCHSDDQASHNVKVWFNQEPTKNRARTENKTCNSVEQDENRRTSRLKLIWNINQNYLKTTNVLCGGINVMDKKSNENSRKNMKLNQILLAITITGGLAFSGEVQGKIVYGVSLVIGAGGVVGTLTTDGHIGVIGATNILAWNFIVTGNGGVTYNLVSGPSGVDCGNNTAVFNPTAGTRT